MTKDINGLPSSQPGDGSHIAPEVRAALTGMDPEIAAQVRSVADYVPGRLRENGTGRPADGTPAKRRSPNGR